MELCRKQHFGITLGELVFRSYGFGKFLLEWGYQKVERKIRNCRIAVLVCGVIIIASSICLMALGFRQINHVLDYTHQNLPVSHHTF